MRGPVGLSVLGTVTVLIAACDPPSVSLWNPAPAAASNTAPPADEPATPAAEPVELVPVATVARSDAASRLRLDVVLNILHVRIPAAERATVEPLWNHLREEVLDSATLLRLRRNGLRVGITHDQWWDAVRAALDAADGVRTQTLDPVRIPPGYPLALELDERPREQTLFFVADDGILSGESWPQSRNVLRVTYELNRTRPECIRLSVVPEVRQRLDGWRWVRSESGLLQAPQYAGRAFPAAGFTIDLEPGEFLLVAPSRQADLFGIIGGALLSSDRDGERLDSYVFLRADVNHVAYRH